MIFCMSHGQASIKRGFNDSIVVLKYNLEENTIIARRFIKIIFMLIPYTIQINNELLKSIKCAKQRYEIHLKKQKKSWAEELVEVNNELQTMTVQCSTLEDNKEIRCIICWYGERSRRKEHDALCHWREYIKK